MTAILSLDRRRMMAATAAAAAFAGPAAAVTTPVKATPFKRLLDQFAEELLRLTPETATSLGLDTGARAALKSRFADATPAADTRFAQQLQSMLTRLKALDRSKLSPNEQVRYDTVVYSAQSGVDGRKYFYAGAAQGFFGGANPYPVTQQDGAMTQIPEFLNSQHQIRNAADAEAYLSRVAKMAVLLDQESAQITRDAAKGVMPPAFIARTALNQLDRFVKMPAANQTLVTSLADRTAKLGIAGAWGQRATRMVERLVYPAIGRQIAALTKATATAPDTPGVHRLPDGEAYYRWALQLSTTTTRTAEEIHALGMEQNRAIQSRMDAILKSQGLTNGSVGERVLALTKDPAQLYPDTPAGREALIAYCNEKAVGQRALMPGLTRMDLKAPLIIKRVPEDIQDGASLGYMNYASLDGSRPAIYYINLKSTTLWPKYQLSTLTAHEGIPGHAWQGAYLAERSAEIPLIASITGFNAFAEGWALYSEQLVDEAGFYKGDPFGQIGYLQAQQFRACRLVVDTGLHALKWSREQAIRFLVENTGRGENSMTSEVDRYSVSPGQACGYKMGHNEILALRERAKAKLGGKFDLAGFNDAIVQTGGAPLAVLSTAIDQFIARG